MPPCTTPAAEWMARVVADAQALARRALDRIPVEQSSGGWWWDAGSFRRYCWEAHGA